MKMINDFYQCKHAGIIILVKDKAIILNIIPIRYLLLFIPRSLNLINNLPLLFEYRSRMILIFLFQMYSYYSHFNHFNLHFKFIDFI